MKIKISILVFFFLSCFAAGLSADTIYLKNGRSLEGLIKKEDDRSVELDVGFGSVKFNREEIESIYRSNPEEVKLIYKEWEHQKQIEEKRRLRTKESQKKTRRKKYFAPKETEFSQPTEHIIVNVLLNKRVRGSFLLDTGASLVVLSSDIAKRLNIRTKGKKEEIVRSQMADGSQVDGRFIVLDTLSVGEIEAKNVEALVLPDYARMDLQDGLLGMSFLNRFNFQIDTEKKKLILKRRKR